MKKYVLLSILFLLSCILTRPVYSQTAALISDHLTAQLSLISEADVALAKATLHIAYGHTSHGSQLITGMEGLLSFKPGYDTLYAFNPGGLDGALDLREPLFSGASDLGNPDFTAWATATRTYLDAHLEVNVIIWSWCGQVSDASAANITTYLTLMEGLEQDYPGVSFVYMTGHLDGEGLIGNLHLRNEQIRAYCRENNKILFDFADIESYDPDGNYFLDKLANDNCDYDWDGDGILEPPQEGGDDRNWAIDWQTSHTMGVDWYDCDPAHTQALNGNLKAYAAWYLWAGIAKRKKLTIPCDFDGDGDSDIGVWRPSTGKWFIKDQTSPLWGASGDIPVPEDYDGDGDSDIAVWRPSNGTWYIQGQSAIAWGVSTDIPVPGDYDGDGDVDLAVWRPSNGRWYIQGQSAVAWGVATDIPVPGDYDGDGDTDIGVWRPATGKWFIKDQTSPFWGASGDIPQAQNVWIWKQTGLIP